jgi:hypothetical protein
MGWFDDIFGGDTKKSDKTSSTSSGKSSTTKLEGQETASVTGVQSATEGQTTQVQTQGNTTQNLSDANRGILDQLIAKASGVNNVNSGRSSASVDLQASLAQKLASKVEGQGANLDGLIKAQQEAAKLNFAENQGAQISQFADNVGSSMNSTVQLLKTKGDRDLAVQLAALAADTTLQSRTIDNQETAIAADAATKATGASLDFDAGSSKALADAISALTAQKGTVTSSLDQLQANQVQSQQSNTQTVLEELLKNLTTLDTEESSTSTGKGTTTGTTGGNAGGAVLSLLDILSR